MFENSVCWRQRSPSAFVAESQPHQLSSGPALKPTPSEKLPQAGTTIAKHETREFQLRKQAQRTMVAGLIPSSGTGRGASADSAIARAMGAGLSEFWNLLMRPGPDDAPWESLAAAGVPPCPPRRGRWRGKSPASGPHHPGAVTRRIIMNQSPITVLTFKLPSLRTLAQLA